MEKISVILPAYNELDNLRALIPALKIALQGCIYEILVVDDNSADGTKQFLEHQDDLNVRWMIRANRGGLGSAIADGIEKTEGDLIIIMDSDFNHSPEDLKPMLALLSTADFVSGSRFLKGARTDYPLRTFLSRLFNYFIRFKLSSFLTDHLFGLCVFRRKLLIHLKDRQVFQGFGDYYIRLLYYFEKAGVSIVECPIYHCRRYAGRGNRNLLKITMDYSRSVMQLSKERLS